jgi:hypothetical protein
VVDSGCNIDEYHQPARKCETLDCLENMGASTSHKPMGLHGLLQDSFTLTGDKFVFSFMQVKGKVVPVLN